MIEPLDKWDESYFLSEIVPADESEALEKKSSLSWVVNSRGKLDGASSNELAKQVCAFSNSGAGVLVYGVSKNKTLDTGIPLVVGSTPVKEWVEQSIPQLCFPPVTQCTARSFSTPSIHVTGFGILAISIPLSESRPHWSVASGKEIAYIRAGEHSEQMRLQTLLDVSSRSASWNGEILTLNHLQHPRLVSGETFYRIQPLVRLTSGVVCERWGFELKVETGSVMLAGDSHPNFRVDKSDHIFFLGDAPLFPYCPSFASNGITVIKRKGSGEVALMATLHLGVGRPIQRTFRLEEMDVESAKRLENEPRG